MSSDKRKHLTRAVDLLRDSDNDSLPYAALELRFTIEALAYDKLRLSAVRLPASVIDKWQPPQALKALLEFEPLATENHVLRSCQEASPGVPSGGWVELGEHRSLTLDWARHSYNKLGSYLHLLSPRADRRSTAKGDAHLATIREDLTKIAAELEPLVSSRIDSSLASVFQFECKVCGQPIVRNAQSLREKNMAICLNTSCRAEYYCSETDDGSEFTVALVASNFACAKCGHENAMENRFLELGYEFRCVSCKTVHRFVQRNWGYQALEDSIEAFT